MGSSIDVDSTGRLPKATVITSLSSPSSPAGTYSYDQIRETLKAVSLDSSGNVELDDFVDLAAKLKEGKGSGAGVVHRGGALSGLVAGVTPTKPSAGAGHGGGKVLVQGSNTNITHSINEDERTEFTRHINSVRSLPLIGGS
jgi:plastin-1